MKRTRIPRSLILVLAGATAGVAAVVLASRDLPPPPELQQEDWVYQRPDGTPLEITPLRPLELPYLFGDCELSADLELGDGVALDLLVRAVAPRRRHGDMPLFHARFASVRLSTAAAGPSVRTREAALFDPTPGGSRLSPGRPATVTIRAVGHQIDAVVAGVRSPPFETADAYGAFTMIARGGPAGLRRLRITLLPGAGGVPAVGWGGLVGAILGLLLWLRRAAPVQIVAALVALAAGGWLVGSWLFGQLAGDAAPTLAGQVLGALLGAPLALGIGLVGRSRPVLGVIVAVVVGGCGSLVVAEAIVRIERPRLELFEDPRLDATFGPLSGTAPIDALSRRLRARAAVHIPDQRERRVMLLGGGQLFESSDQPETWIGAITAAQVGGRIGSPVDVVVVPTIYSNVRQQLELFSAFYAADYRPDVVVLAVPPWEGEPDESPASRAWLDASDTDRTPAQPAESTWVLLELWRRATAPRVPTTDAVGLGRAVTRFATLAAATGFAPVLVLSPDVMPDLHEAATAAAATSGMTVLEVPLTVDNEAATAALVAVLEPLLRR